MPETFTRWDVTEHLGTEEDARLYLEACAEEDPGDGSLIRAALNDIAPPQNMTRLAHEVGVTREGLYKALSDNGCARQPKLCHSHANYPRARDETADYCIRRTASFEP